MKCENCPALDRFWGGDEFICQCRCGTSEDEAYHENTDTWSCRRSLEQVKRVLKSQEVSE